MTAVAGRQGWQFWIDRGGTFTDVIGRAPGGALHVRKELSDRRGSDEDAAIAGMRALLGVVAGEPFPADRVTSVRMGTTVATNALLERRGARTLLVVTEGFGDLLRIGDQERPELFALHVRTPELLYAQVLEAPERIGADGVVICALDTTVVERQLQRARSEGIEAVAIALVHGYRYPEHERRIAELARAAGFEQVSVSSEVNPLVRLIARADTTVADAYVSQVLHRYLHRFRAELGGVPVAFMQSHGGLAALEQMRACHSVLSGPAGGVVGAAAAATEAGAAAIIGFDMGGTSTDVSYFDGAHEYSLDQRVAGVRLRVPMMQITTIAAGGGSIVRCDGERLRVGPESAGAVPGPACYRLGGPLTLTDCNLLLGRIDPLDFPHVFGPDGDQGLDSEAVRSGFVGLARRVNEVTGDAYTSEQLAEGFLRIAVDQMAAAIKQVSLRRGRDVRSATLCAFGGAGGLHACRVAEALGMRRILLHPLAGVLSAYGIGCARTAEVRQRSLDADLGEDVQEAARSLEQEVTEVLRARGEVDVQCEILVWIKVRGADAPLAVALAAVVDMREAFAQVYRQRYAVSPPDAPLVVDRIEARASIAAPASEWTLAVGAAGAEPVRWADFCDAGAWLQVPVYQRERLGSGAEIVGPAIITEAQATHIVENGWCAETDARGNLLLRQVIVDAEQRPSDDRQLDRVRLELFNSLFMSIAEQMGAVLQRTALSINIRERLDFSCALFDAEGNLIANAPHMPVHLGSMGEAVVSVMQQWRGRMRPGDAYAGNDPVQGGTHLPDVTVVSPVFIGAAESPQFFVAARGHHADIGGVTPGSMPPQSTALAQEGVLLRNLLVERDGALCESKVLAALNAGPWPVRNPQQNLADLRAQIAANRCGIAALHEAADRHGLGVLGAYATHVQDSASRAVQRALDGLHDGDFTFEADNGCRVQVAVRINQQQHRVLVDFSGTSPQGQHNFNAPCAVCKAAVLYVFRTLVREDIAMNQGCLRPIDIRIPPGSLLDPAAGAAVAAGNVETSQWLCNALYGALGVVAASQGTMNNLTFGDASYQYYETIAGGTGAGEGFAGADGVQSHMTNSRLTDVEVLELNHPVRVRRFAVRTGSGGGGRYRGGDGLVREIEFLRPMQVGILSSHRSVAPFGLVGGGAGAVGINTVVRADGTVEDLGPTASAELRAGDRIRIETPGGGGWGSCL